MRPYRFHLIGLIVGLVLLGVLVTAEVPEFPLIQQPGSQEDGSLREETRAADDRPTGEG